MQTLRSHSDFTVFRNVHWSRPEEHEQIYPRHVHLFSILPEHWPTDVTCRQQECGQNGQRWKFWMGSHAASQSCHDSHFWCSSIISFSVCFVLSFQLTLLSLGYLCPRLNFISNVNVFSFLGWTFLILLDKSSLICKLSETEHSPKCPQFKQIIISIKCAHIHHQRRMLISTLFLDTLCDTFFHGILLKTQENNICAYFDTHFNNIVSKNNFWQTIFDTSFDIHYDITFFLHFFQTLFSTLL